MDSVTWCSVFTKEMCGIKLVDLHWPSNVSLSRCSSALVVKPSGHHLKLALKMQNYAKAMFKPMRWGLNTHSMSPWSISKHNLLYFMSVKQHSPVRPAIHLKKRNIGLHNFMVHCLMSCPVLIYVRLNLLVSVKTLVFVLLQTIITDSLISVCACVCVCQAAEGWGDSRRLLLLCWLPKTQCRDCCLSPGQVPPPPYSSCCLSLDYFSCSTLISVTLKVF